ncbi:MAG: hypothetical protein AM326_06875 [Candidatus Thorarchaeota archaeon SMTZ-45]|nr:MAG: hypothetical protein AM325_05115 [Candidatus Thorarchaeota archaeon SMTZ1-45]KXH76640.1 MAG: hypothetical protein AM326_06875 [Candidatus Thorarchaeota archaeon SMTZ-45]
MCSETTRKNPQLILTGEITLIIAISSILISIALLSELRTLSLTILGVGTAFLLLTIGLLYYDKSNSKIGENLSTTGIWGICILAASSVTVWVQNLFVALSNIIIGDLLLFYALSDKRRR